MVTSMIIRTWRTRIDQSRSREYERFAEEYSLPMFRAHAGCRGVVFAGDADQRMVVTFWASREAVRELESSDAYQRTVSAIMATGFVLEEGTVEVFRIHGGAVQAFDMVRASADDRNGH